MQQSVLVYQPSLVPIRADGQQNGWKYYRAKEIDELISANMIMCAGRVRWTVRTADYSDVPCSERACVRLTWFRDEIHLEIKQAPSPGHSPALRHVSLSSSSDSAAETGDGDIRARLRLSNFVCFEQRLDCLCSQHLAVYSKNSAADAVVSLSARGIWIE